ncbi:hypothetical protein BIW11_07678 [Tropilaelaps mercedesae]|uniref:Uncharacterized protein n=1 Tax=Tropilaelaps mercedesae TaxID=418985 RepID=A0A1V9XSZ5_9ACAR|nr:hypothetical protein BIW11_07678 [Tropilaelaps mercedesae]
MLTTVALQDRRFTYPMDRSESGHFALETTKRPVRQEIGSANREWLRGSKNEKLVCEMKRNKKVVAKLEQRIAQLDRYDREYLRLRVEFLLMQIDIALCTQYKSVMTLHDGSDLLAMLEDAMATTEKFRQWFHQYMRQGNGGNLDRYLNYGVSVNRNEGKPLRKILSKMMVLLPASLTLDVQGCHCLHEKLQRELIHGYCITMRQGQKKVFAVLDAEDARDSNRVVLQVSLDPTSPMEISICVPRKLTSLRALIAFLTGKNRKRLFSESYDPVTLFGFEGSFYCRRGIELPVAVRLWPKAECEALFQELTFEMTPTTTSSTC